MIGTDNQLVWVETLNILVALEQRLRYFLLDDFTCQRRINHFTLLINLSSLGRVLKSRANRKSALFCKKTCTSWSLKERTLLLKTMIKRLLLFLLTKISKMRCSTTMLKLSQQGRWIQFRRLLSSLINRKKLSSTLYSTEITVTKSCRPANKQGTKLHLT